MSRNPFSEHEKVCLQELILKYKLNSAATIGAGNPAAKKTAWARLTEEYNSIETNSKRTEAQLRKCWDNLKTRRKQSLAHDKRERMRTGGGICVPSTSRVTEQSIDAALLDSTNIELQFVYDSDFDMGMNSNIPVSAPAAPAAATAGDAAQVQESSTIDVETSLGSRQDDHDYHEVPPQTTESVAAAAEETPFRPSAGSRLSDYTAPSQTTVPKNIRAHVINEEFPLRKQTHLMARQREEELHNLKIAEREWLVKAAEENFRKAHLERQSAEELLKCSQAQRELAELQLAYAKK